MKVSSLEWAMEDPASSQGIAEGSVISQGADLWEESGQKEQEMDPTLGKKLLKDKERLLCGHYVRGDGEEY